MVLVLPTLLSVLMWYSVEGCGPGRGGIRRRGPRKLTPLVYKQHVPNFSEKSLAASGLNKDPVDRSSPEFRRLVPNYNPDVLFKDEEGTGADRLMTQRCKEKLNTLAISVMNQWPGVRLRVIEGWDEDRHHSHESLHYEGRALDFTTSDRDRRKYGLLARLAVESGFDWVYYESRTHIHASCKSEETNPSKHGGCFKGESIVLTETGDRKQLKDLQIGESVLTVDSYGKLEFSPIILFLHKNPEETRRFQVLRTEDGQVLTLTPTHLLYVQYRSGEKDEEDDDDDDNDNEEDREKTHRVVFARDVDVDDYVIVHDGKGSLISSRVIAVESSVETSGVYAPLTRTGTIIVNGVVASCYAVIDSQSLAHSAFLPIRLLSNIVSFSNSNQVDEDGIHPYARMLYVIAEYVMPQWLFSS